MFELLKKTFLTPSPLASEAGQKRELMIRKLFLALVVAVFVGYLALQLATAHKTNSFDTELPKAVQKMNASMPMTMAEGIRMDEVALLSPTEVQYTATLTNIAKDEIDIEKFKSTALPMVVQSVKGNPALREYAGHNVTLSYLMKDKAGIEITKINLTPDMYR